MREHLPTYHIMYILSFVIICIANIGSQVSVGTTNFPSLSQIGINSISTSNPLWCQGSSSSDSVSWILPSGEVVVAGDTPVGLTVVSASGTLGLFPALPLTEIPPGIYTCVVNGQSSSFEVGSVFESPSVSSSSCQLEDDPLQLNISAVVSNGLPNTVSCSPPATETSILPRTTTAPFEFDVSVVFDPAVTGQTYTCTISNDAGSASQITCSILASPADFSAARDPSDPSRVTFSWQPVTGDPAVTGYSIIISSTNGTPLRTVQIPSSSDSTVDVDGLDPQQPLAAVISPTSSSISSSLSTTSDPVFVPGVGTTQQNTTMQCRAAGDRRVEICLRRDLNEGETDSSACDCNMAGFARSVLEAVFNSSCISEEECSSLILRNEECVCKEEREETGSKKNAKHHGKTGCKGEKTSKGKKKGKGRSNEKTGVCHNDGTDSAKVCVQGNLVCGSCDVAGAKRRKRDNIRGHLRLGRKTSTKYCGTKRRTKRGLLRNCKKCMVSFESNDYDIEEIKIEASKFFCGDTEASQNDRCDCPEFC